nr:hypothetical protein [Tanacetum cinerariifolium]
MSSSTVTYTSVYTDSEQKRVYWGADEELSDGGPEYPPSPDYVPGPEHPPSPVEVSYAPEPEHPEYLVPSEDEAPIEDQPLPRTPRRIMLTILLMEGMVMMSPPMMTMMMMILMMRMRSPLRTRMMVDGRDGDDKPFNDDDDDDDDDTDDEDEDPFEDEEDDEEEEEHLALADSFVVHIMDLVPPTDDTESFETDEAAGIRMRALLLPTSYKNDVPEAEKPPQKRACFTTPSPGLEVGENSAASVARQPGHALEADHSRDRVEGMGYGDRPFHRHTVMLFDRDATYGRRACAGSKDRSAAIEAHVRTLEAHVAALIAMNSSLQT